MSSDVVPAYLRWALLRAALARGWWLVTALYLVLDAHLDAPQLVLVGVFQGLVVLLAEIPAGVLADTTSRRLALVLAHLVMGTGMALTGVVTGYPVLVVTQCLWGLGWALSSGADVAWITDELARPDRVDRVLVGQARRELAGTVAGLVAAATLAGAVGRPTAILVLGTAMVALGATVARWPETGFVPAPAERRWRQAVGILREGARAARAERVVAAVLVATFLLHGGREAYGRLFERHVLGLGLPVDPLLWFTGLALAAAATGALVLRVVEARIDDPDGARRAAAGAGAVGAVGVLVFAQAPDAPTAAAGEVLVTGIAFPVARIAGTVLVNRRVTGRVRATVHSMASQAENGGEMVLGLALAGVAADAPRVALVVSAVLVAASGLVVSRGCRR